MTFEGADYTVNKEFQDQASQLADTLELNEIEAARLLINAQEDLDAVDRPPVIIAIVNFQQRRQLRLECLRLLLSLAVNGDVGDDIRGPAREIVSLVLGMRNVNQEDGFDYIKKCFQAMFNIEAALHFLSQRQQGSIALGVTEASDAGELVSFQQQSLTEQHQSLSGIVASLVKASYSTASDFRLVLSHSAQMDRWSRLAAHYTPIILAMTFQHGSPEGTGSLREARSLHSTIVDGKDASSWMQRQLQAAVQIWWLSEYSGWYQEPQDGSPLQGVDLEAEALARSETFLHALRDGALECVLSLCSQVSSVEVPSPARDSLVAFLLRDAPSLQQDQFQTSDWFNLGLMEQLETFADALITNMPDTLRQFKYEEDDQRKRFHSNLQQTARVSTGGQDFHLERFLVIIAFSFDHRPDAAQAFWSDPDSNLYGFLQWAAKRQSTPCASAFCEMLQSISQGEEYATAAHEFLLGEGNGLSAKSRRYGSLSWSQILGELATYAGRVREPPNVGRSSRINGSRLSADEIDEPESALMLESYLRLISHLCTESERVRSWVIFDSNTAIPETMLTLCNATIPDQLQACALSMVRSLLTNMSSELSMSVWIVLDGWASGGFAPSSIARPKNASPLSWLKDVTSNAIAGSFESANEFTRLLHALVTPPANKGNLRDYLPFPENLGSNYRRSGMDPYIDMVMENILLKIANIVEDKQRASVLIANVLDFVSTCLDTFNESLLLLANKSSLVVDELISTTNLATYVKLHPFRRIMDWLFNNEVISVLMAILHQHVGDLLRPQPSSTIMKCVLRCLDVLDQMTNLQSTYFNIVRPIAVQQAVNRHASVSSSSLTSFEDAVALNLQIILDLGLYAGAGDQDLTIASLKLLGKLTSSRRLKGLLVKPLQKSRKRDLLLDMMQREGELSRISKPFAHAMATDARDLEYGPQSPDWSIKAAVLAFIVKTLSAAPDQPNLAHALLGFVYHEDERTIALGKPLGQEPSLFHAILRLVGDYPDGFDEALEVWALSIRQMGMEVLTLLWRSTLTSAVTLREMQRCEFLQHLLSRQRGLNSSVVFDGRTVRDPEFLFSESAEALCQTLWQRNALYELSSNEIRFITTEGTPAMKLKTISALIGSSVPSHGVTPSLGIFGLLDFCDIDVPSLSSMPRLDYFSNIDLDVCREDQGVAGTRYNLVAVADILSLSMNDIRKQGLLQDPTQDQRAVSELELLRAYCQGSNNVRDLRLANESAMASWSLLVSLLVSSFQNDKEGQKAFVLQALQVLTPRLETYILEGDPGAGHVATLLRNLLIYQDADAVNPSEDQIGHDRVFQVFRTALRSISVPDIDIGLRSILYSLCHQCLGHWSRSSLADSGNHQFLQTLKASGQRTIDVLCDDALGARSSVSIAALLLLDNLCTCTNQGRSSAHVLECLLRTNFIQVLVEGIESIPHELRQAAASG